MTPCEKLGYKVGDRFEIRSVRYTKRHRQGVKVMLCLDDGSDSPYFKPVNATDCDGVDKWCHNLNEVRKLEEDNTLRPGVHDSSEEQADEKDTIEALLAKADKHARKAAKHEAKRQECIDKARALMPDGWGIDDDRKRIRLGDEPKEDMSDPANWREGDVVECVRSISDTSKGSLYTLEIDPSDGRLSHRDDAGDWCFLFESHFRFHHRPI